MLLHSKKALSEAHRCSQAKHCRLSLIHIFCILQCLLQCWTVQTLTAAFDASV